MKTAIASASPGSVRGEAVQVGDLLQRPAAAPHRDDAGEGAGAHEHIDDQIDQHAAHAFRRADRQADQRVAHVADRGIRHQPLDVVSGRSPPARRGSSRRSDTSTMSCCQAISRWPNGVAIVRSSSANRRDLRRGGEEHRDRRRRALVDVGRPHVERHGGDLEREADQHEHDADDQSGRGALPAASASWPARRNPSCRRSHRPAKCRRAAGRRRAR